MEIIYREEQLWSFENFAQRFQALKMQEQKRVMQCLDDDDDDDDDNDDDNDDGNEHDECVIMLTPPSECKVVDQFTEIKLMAWSVGQFTVPPCLEILSW